MRDKDGNKPGPSGIDWDRVRRVTRLKNGGRVDTTTSKEFEINSAIHKLITIKKRRMNDGESPHRVRAVQIEIDKLMKMKRDVRAASAFMEWRKTHE
jgi:hypothetical protein